MIRTCTAGYSFYVISEEGVVRRCWFHHDEVCGSVRDLTLTTWTNPACHARTCAPTCEPTYCTIVEPNQPAEVGSYVNWDEPDPVNRPQTRHVLFQVYLTDLCNYTCPYCIAGCNFNKPHRPKALVTADEWVAWWDMIYARFDSCGVSLVGGEPTLFPDFERVLRAVGRLAGPHRLFTNLSLDRGIEPLLRGEYSNFLVHAAAHPSNANFDLDAFVRRLLQIKKTCYADAVIVNARENSDRIFEIVRTLRANDIRVSVLRDEVKTRERVHDSMYQSGFAPKGVGSARR